VPSQLSTFDKAGVAGVELTVKTTGCKAEHGKGETLLHTLAYTVCGLVELTKAVLPVPVSSVVPAASEYHLTRYVAGWLPLTVASDSVKLKVAVEPPGLVEHFVWDAPEPEGMTMGMYSPSGSE
jgi:hypothetical protein